MSQTSYILLEGNFPTKKNIKRFFIRVFVTRALLTQSSLFSLTLLRKTAYKLSFLNLIVVNLSFILVNKQLIPRKSCVSNSRFSLLVIVNGITGAL